MGDQVDYWIEQVLNGQREGFAHIVRAYQVQVWRMVARVLQNPEAADNLAQQVFVDAFVHLEQFEPGRDFGVWLRGIVRNRLRMELRRLAQEDRRLARYREHLLARVADADGAEQEEAYRSALEDCRGRLPEKSARLVELRYVRSLGFDEIAEREGTSPGAVQRTLSRIRLLLRDCIQAKLVTP